jgi:HPt (histidine-containing phosphotransfer) domain-containing protein
LVDVFGRDYPQNIAAIKSAITAQNAPELQRSAHTLKGALGNLSATRAVTLAAELERMGRTVDLSDAQSTLDSLISELPNVTRALESLCPIAMQ